MPSQALDRWHSERAVGLDGLLDALGVVRAAGPAHRGAVQHLARGFVVALSAEFQAFCKDLHRECAAHFASLVPAAIEDVVLQQFLAQRLLDRGNPNPGNIGADFNRLGLKLFDEARGLDARVDGWRADLDFLNEWRNAVAHSDYSSPRVANHPRLGHNQLRSWRSACNRLAAVFERVLGRYLETKTGVRPW